MLAGSATAIVAGSAEGLESCGVRWGLLWSSALRPTLWAGSPPSPLYGHPCMVDEGGRKPKCTKHSWQWAAGRWNQIRGGEDELGGGGGVWNGGSVNSRN